MELYRNDGMLKNEYMNMMMINERGMSMEKNKQWWSKTEGALSCRQTLNGRSQRSAKDLIHEISKHLNFIWIGYLFSEASAWYGRIDTELGRYFDTYEQYF